MANHAFPPAQPPDPSSCTGMGLAQDEKEKAPMTATELFEASRQAYVQKRFGEAKELIEQFLADYGESEEAAPQ